MDARCLTPILNVSSLPASFVWFEAFGWTKLWEWHPPGSEAGEATFGAVGSGTVEIFLCRDGQGGRGAAGSWMSVWVDDVDAVHERCRREGMAVLQAPRDEPWGVREMHVRHPDGHVLRVGTGLAED